MRSVARISIAYDCVRALCGPFFSKNAFGVVLLQRRTSEATPRHSQLALRAWQVHGCVRYALPLLQHSSSRARQRGATWPKAAAGRLASRLRVDFSQFCSFGRRRRAWYWAQKSRKNRKCNGYPEKKSPAAPRFFFGWQQNAACRTAPLRVRLRKCSANIACAGQTAS